LLYGFLLAKWQFVDDFKKIALGRIAENRIPRPRGWVLVELIGGKVAFLAWAFLVPMLFHPWWVVLLFYGATAFLLGIVLSVVFQLAHCVEEARFTEPPGDTLRLEAAWAVHQVESTVDFGRDSRLLAWLLGGLNFQIEHHLFPKVCHIHYPALSSIVEQTCHDFGVRYVEHPTFWAGLVSHHRWLKRLGRQDDGNDSNAPPTSPSGQS
jgi:linoleoyl-CoA desaturase